MATQLGMDTPASMLAAVVNRKGLNIRLDRIARVYPYKAGYLV